MIALAVEPDDADESDELELPHAASRDAADMPTAPAPTRFSSDPRVSESIDGSCSCSRHLPPRFW